LASLLATLVAPDATRADQSAAAAVYVRQDTDHTTVVSPRLRLRAPVTEDAHLDLAYTVDVWTSASVDIVASASQPVTEQRDELNVGTDLVVDDLTLAVAYRWSSEPDYESHGGSASAAIDLAEKATTLAVSAGGSVDRVGRVGNPRFDEAVSTLVVGASVTQVIDAETVVQGLYDLSVVRGYQASAYRFVALGGDGTCDGVGRLCAPEQNPRERLRHALALRLRRALGAHFSVGAGYRFYFDDWGILSHTPKLELAWTPEPDAVVSLGYRFYIQGAAAHYQAHYTDADLGAVHFTHDKELSPLSSHRVGLTFDRVWRLQDGATGLITGLEVAPTAYRYTSFPELDQVIAIEVTTVVGMELP
jgi:hypothetical protein